MLRTISIVSLATLFCGCATEGKFVNQSKDNDCDGKGTVSAFIKYGDSYIDVTPHAKVKRKGEIIFKLVPQRNSDFGIDYTKLDITIAGKNASDNWLDTNGKQNDGKKIFVCVADTQALGDYEYLVEVPGVGTIDPRVSVVKD